VLFFYQKEGVRMKKILIKYSGAILFYSVIIIGVFALNARFKYLNEKYVEGDKASIVALGN
jgi:hypothetical protein